MAAVSSDKQGMEGKGARRRKQLYLVFVCGFSIWAGFSLLEQTSAMKEQEDQMEQLQLMLEEVRATREAYQLEVTRLHDPEYIEQKVRKDYGMVRPGDIPLD